MRLAPILSAMVSGGLFGGGLYVSQMVDPNKVLRFLDVSAIPAGGWDPSVAFVMVPALIIMAVALQFGRRRGAPFFDARFHQPRHSRIDFPMVGGAALFGLGWGLSGLCPGPALALIAFMPEGLWVFLLALALGTAVGRLLTRPSAPPAPVTA